MMKAKIAALLVAAAVTLGGCHVFKQHPVAGNAHAVKQVVLPVASVEELDIRVTNIEHRLDAAKLARARAAMKPLPLK